MPAGKQSKPDDFSYEATIFSRPAYFVRDTFFDFSAPRFRIKQGLN
jgi:hypothetical protein